MNKTLRIATRKSPLALWQAEDVRKRLLDAHPGLSVELLTMTTKGDQLLHSPLAKIGGKGLFVKELEIGMLEGRADLAVHSMKDVPVTFPEGLQLTAILNRENPYDAFVSNDFDSPEDLPDDARVGTCSLRRQCQLKARFPGFRLMDLRGNLNTRLAKLDAGEFDAIILACAGLIRLQMSERIRTQIPAENSLPAVGQGAIGIECRSDDEETRNLVSVLHDPSTGIRIRAERAMNQRLNGGCQVPIAGFAELEKDRLKLRGLVGTTDGAKILYSENTADTDDPEALGIAVAEDLLTQGAAEILASVLS